MLNKEKMIDTLNDIFDQAETESEIMEFNCILLNFASEVCKAFGEESGEEGENDTDIS